MKRYAAPLCALFLCLAPAALAAQITLSPKIGSAGIGADLGIGLSDGVVLRGGLGLMPFEPETEDGGIDWKLKFPNNATVGLDLHPGGGAFRLSLGALFQTKELELEGIVGDQVDIGDESYDGSQLNSLGAVLESPAVAPFATLGFGHHGRSGLGLFFEVGAAYMGDPDITLSAEGSATSLPGFQANLTQEEAQLEDDIGPYAKWWPLVNLGIRIGL